MVDWDTSYRRLLSSICTGSIGKKGKNSEAPATLNMLPKFELTHNITYFMVLQKDQRPPSTPSPKTVKSFLKSIMSADSLATSTALSTDTPTSDVFKEGASLIPSPM